jgi:ribonucleoside-diphosphate reductase alpha chain
MFYALNKIAMDEPDWSFVAARLYMDELYFEAAKNRKYNEELKYGPLYDLIAVLIEKKIYSPDLLAFYTKEEIEELSKEIDPIRDNLFTYIGLFLLSDRYLARDHERNLFELPQERFMIIAMALMMDEDKSKRLSLVKEAYGQ